MNNYAEWKKIAWRYGRVFMGAFLASLALNWQNVRDLNDLLPLFIIPAMTAGITAVGKAIREWLASGNYKSLVHKLPF